MVELIEKILLADVLQRYAPPEHVVEFAIADNALYITISKYEENNKTTSAERVTASIAVDLDTAAEAITTLRRDSQRLADRIRRERAEKEEMEYRQTEQKETDLKAYKVWVDNAFTAQMAKINELSQQVVRQAIELNELREKVKPKAKPKATKTEKGKKE